MVVISSLEKPITSRALITALWLERSLLEVCNRKLRSKVKKVPEILVKWRLVN